MSDEFGEQFSCVFFVSFVVSCVAARFSAVFFSSVQCVEPESIQQQARKKTRGWKHTHTRVRWYFWSLVPTTTAPPTTSTSSQLQYITTTAVTNRFYKIYTLARKDCCSHILYRKWTVVTHGTNSHSQFRSAHSQNKKINSSCSTQKQACLRQCCPFKLSYTLATVFEFQQNYTQTEQNRERARHIENIESIYKVQAHFSWIKTEGRLSKIYSHIITEMKSNKKLNLITIALLFMKSVFVYLLAGLLNTWFACFFFFAYKVLTLLFFSRLFCMEWRRFNANTWNAISQIERWAHFGDENSEVVAFFQLHIHNFFLCFLCAATFAVFWRNTSKVKNERTRILNIAITYTYDDDGYEFSLLDLTWLFKPMLRFKNINEQ